MSFKLSLLDVDFTKSLSKTKASFMMFNSCSPQKIIGRKTSKPDPGRIYIKGYISYPYIPKSPKKGYFLSLFGEG
jgi:hypothetical protein